MMRLVAAAMSGGLVAASLLFAAPATADIKIGVIYDHTGAFAAGGSKAAAIGNKIAIDLVNEKGGVKATRSSPSTRTPNRRRTLPSTKPSGS